MPLPWPFPLSTLETVLVTIAFMFYVIWRVTR